jgi:hypothetical protein
MQHFEGRFRAQGMDLAKVLGYIFDTFARAEDGVLPETVLPETVWLALCHLAMPDRRWRSAMPEDDSNDLVHLDAIFDEDTGETAREVLANAEEDARWLVQARQGRAEARWRAQAAAENTPPAP